MCNRDGRGAALGAGWAWLCHPGEELVLGSFTARAGPHLCFHCGLVPRCFPVAMWRLCALPPCPVQSRVPWLWVVVGIPFLSQKHPRSMASHVATLPMALKLSCLCPPCCAAPRGH